MSQNLQFEFCEHRIAGFHMNNGSRLYDRTHQRDTFPSAKYNSPWLVNAGPTRAGLLPEDERLILRGPSQCAPAANTNNPGFSLSPPSLLTADNRFPSSRKLLIVS